MKLRSGKQKASHGGATAKKAKRLKIGEEGICQIPDLDKDVMFEILARLPIESLLRFKTVSKYWFGLISSPDFIKFREKTAREDPNYSHHKLLYISWKNCKVELQHVPLHPILCDPIHKYRLQTTVSHPIEFWQEESDGFRLKFVGSCSGLVCIVGLNHRLIVWNPALRKCKRLPYFGRGSPVFYGFGYDESSDDFKVVGIRNSPKTLVKVYSARNNSWKILQDGDSEVGFVDSHGCLLNGKLLWATNKGIFTVDLSSESFGAMKPPDCVRERKRSDWSIHAFGEFLAVFCFSIPGFNRDQTRLESHADLWILEQSSVKESWTRVSQKYPFDFATHPRHLSCLVSSNFYRIRHCYVYVTTSEPKWRPIPFPGHMTDNAIRAFLFYGVKLDEYSFIKPREFCENFDPFQPLVGYVESFTWPFL